MASINYAMQGVHRGKEWFRNLEKEIGGKVFRGRWQN